MNRRVRLLSLVAVLGVGGGALAACGDDAVAPAPSSAVEVAGAWARTSPMMVSVGAAYFDITSPVDDRLVAVAVDPVVAAMVEIHETVPAGDGDHSDDGDHSGHGEEADHGAMTMREMADGLALPAGETVSLKPGGHHLMLMELVQPLAVGQQFELVLTLEAAGEVPVTVEVRDEAPTTG